MTSMGAVPWPWRVGVAVLALVVVTAPWDARTTVTGVVAVVPVLVWSALPVRSRPVWALVSGVLTLLMAWIVVPRASGWDGRWLVASLGDEFTWYPWLTLVVGAAGLVSARRGTPEVEGSGRPVWPFYVLAVLVGVLACGVSCPLWWVVDLDNAPGAESILPMPAGLVVTADHPDCGSENCVRAVTVTGDRIEARLRAHLAARGFHLRADRSGESAVRITGVLLAHRVGVGYRLTAPDTAVLDWDTDTSMGL